MPTIKILVYATGEKSIEKNVFVTFYSLNAVQRYLREKGMRSKIW